MQDIPLLNSPSRAPVSTDTASHHDGGRGLTISAPHMHAVALELLADQLQPGARVLDVGSVLLPRPSMCILSQASAYLLSTACDMPLHYTSTMFSAVESGT